MRQLASVLILSVLVSLSMPIDVNAQPEVAGASNQQTVVIVHGAWGGSWAFRAVDSLLTERGYRVYRPSLTGLGERVHLGTPDVGLSTHIDDVVNVILFEELTDVVLVGHSYGGMVVTGVADRVPDRVQRLVYVDAFVPNDGESLRSIQGNGGGIEEMHQDGFIVPPWVDPEQAPPRDVPQPAKTFSEPLDLQHEPAAGLPAIYIHAVAPGEGPEDDAFAAQAERARERGWPVRIIDSDHNPQWSAPERLAEMLEEAHRGER